MTSRAKRWRAPVTGAVTGLLVAAAVAGPSALAAGGGAAKPPAAAKTATASGAACPAPATSAEVKERAGGSADDPSPAPFFAAVAQLAQAGTINDHQARILDADIQAGSIDPQQLVASGTLSSAQMQAVMDRLGAVKRSLGVAGPAQPDRQGAERKTSQGSSAPCPKR
jgi:hypothetical protein